MRRWIPGIAAMFLLLTPLHARNDGPVSGSWSAEMESGKFHLSHHFARNSQMGTEMDLADFQGLALSSINSKTNAPVTFTLVREAGTVRYEGLFKDGSGAGHFTFEPNRSFLASLRKLGVRTDDDYDDHTLFHFAVLGVSSDYVRELHSLGFDNLDADDVLGMRIHGVTAERVRAYRAAGYTDLDADEVMAMSIHGVTPAFIQGMESMGFPHASADDLVAMRIHNLTPEFVQEMRALGYTRLDADDFVAMKIHGVTPAFVRELASLGYKNVDGDDLVAMRIHGVTPEFIREANKHAGERISIDDLLEMKIMSRVSRRHRHRG
jgi:hypothetical protein